MVKERSDQLGSIQKNNVFMQIQSVALVLEYEDNERDYQTDHKLSWRNIFFIRTTLLLP